MEENINWQKDEYLDQQSFFEFLTILQELGDDFEVDDLQKISKDITKQKELLRILEETNNTSQEEISTLVSTFSESYSRYINESGKLNMKVGELREILQKKGKEDEGSTTEGKKERQRMEKEYLRMQEHYRIMTDLVSKLGGVRLGEFVEDGVVLQVSTMAGVEQGDEAVTYRLQLRLQKNTCDLAGVSLSPPDIFIEDITQYSIEQGGDVRLFLSEILARIDNYRNRRAELQRIGKTQVVNWSPARTSVTITLAVGVVCEATAGWDYPQQYCKPQILSLTTGGMTDFDDELREIKKKVNASGAPTFTQMLERLNNRINF